MLLRWRESFTFLDLEVLLIFLTLAYYFWNDFEGIYSISLLIFFFTALISLNYFLSFPIMDV